MCSSELKKRLLDPTPRPETTPGEIIETVLMSLRSDPEDDSSGFTGAGLTQLTLHQQHKTVGRVGEVSHHGRSD